MTKIKARSNAHSQFLIESIRSTSLRTPFLNSDDFTLISDLKLILNGIFRHQNLKFMMSHKLMIYIHIEDHSRSSPFFVPLHEA